ncbi:MAG: hypothetical protein CVV25_14210, partial [Ignavibacteriae bacterium HGW-Ignavibacteriae-4]
ENEKTSLDIESPASGVLKIQVPVDVTVPILSPVALLLGSGHVGGHHVISEVVPINTVSNTTNIPPRHESVTPKRSNAIILATPKARILARKEGIDLSSLTGTGIRGMVICADVTQQIRVSGTVRATPLAKLKAAEAGIDLHGVVGSGPRGMVRCGDLDLVPGTNHENQEIVGVRPLSELRSIISSRLSQSWMERPQVTLTTEADATLFVEARKQLNVELAKKNTKISLNTLFVKIAAQAILEFPYMNVSLIPEGLYQHPNINIGLAVDTERGLLVPVLRDANLKSFEGIQHELDGLTERTLNSNNRKDELSGGTFTITNLGTFEIDAFTPIINPPECAILGIGRIHQKPVAYENQIALRNMVSLSLSFDHRLVDGAPAARFLQRIKQFVEQPFLWSLWKN